MLLQNGIWRRPANVGKSPSITVFLLLPLSVCLSYTVCTIKLTHSVRTQNTQTILRFTVASKWKQLWFSQYCFRKILVWSLSPTILREELSHCRIRKDFLFENMSCWKMQNGIANNKKAGQELEESQHHFMARRQIVQKKLPIFSGGDWKFSKNFFTSTFKNPFCTHISFPDAASVLLYFVQRSCWVWARVWVESTNQHIIEVVCLYWWGNVETVAAIYSYIFLLHNYRYAESQTPPPMLWNIANWFLKPGVVE